MTNVVSTRPHNRKAKIVSRHMQDNILEKIPVTILMS